MFWSCRQEEQREKRATAKAEERERLTQLESNRKAKRRGERRRGWAKGLRGLGPARVLSLRAPARSTRPPFRSADFTTPSANHKPAVRGARPCRPARARPSPAR